MCTVIAITRNYWVSALVMDTGALLCATVAIRQARLRARLSAAARRPALRLAIGMSILATGNIVWDVFDVAGSLTSVQVPLGIMFLIGYVFNVGAILAILPMSRSFAGRGRWIDFAVFLAAAGVVVTQLSTNLLNLNALSAGKLLEAISPTITVVLIAVTLRLIAHPARGIPSYWLFVATGAVWASSDMAYSLSTSRGDAADLINGALVCMSYCVAAAAVLHPSFRLLPRSETRVRTGSGERVDRQSILILMVAQSTVPVGIGIAALSQELHWIGIASLATGAIGALAGARTASLFGDRERLRAQLDHSAHHDSLTGLANRAALRMFIDKLGPSAAGCAHVLLFIDLDGFKQVNDSFGHSMGDRLLAEVGGRMVATVGPAGYVARFAGDEFVIILEDHHDGELGVARMRRKLICELERPFDLSGATIEIGASIGQAPLDIGAAADSLRIADAAMYDDKRLRKASRSA